MDELKPKRNGNYHRKGEVNMQNEEAQKLRECPFCGGEAETLGGAYYWVRCKSCGVETKGFHHKWQAIETWNRRVEDGNET